MQDYIQWLTETQNGLLSLLIACSVISIFLIKYVTGFCKWLVTPFVERTFYETILTKWLGPFLSRHKIVATFIKMQGLGDSIVELIIHIIGTFFIVAFLSSALTAMIIDIRMNGFIFSFYLLWLVSMSSMLSWMLCHNMFYFYRVIHRLK